MRSIEGFVCIARYIEPPRRDILFGPKTNSEIEYSYENFTTNNLIPFTELDQIQTSLNELRARRIFKRRSIGHVKLKIAERSEKEIYALEDEKNFIIVVEVGIVSTEFILLGKSVKGSYGVAHAPVSDLLQNGFKTIPKFKDALYALTEV